MASFKDELEKEITANWVVIETKNTDLKFVIHKQYPALVVWYVDKPSRSTMVYSTHAPLYKEYDGSDDISVLHALTMTRTIAVDYIYECTVLRNTAELARGREWRKATLNGIIRKYGSYNPEYFDVIIEDMLSRVEDRIVEAVTRIEESILSEKEFRLRRNIKEITAQLKSWVVEAS